MLFFLRSLRLAFFGFLCCSQCVVADVRLPNIFGDHMVLQQQQPIRFFGWAEPGETVTVKLLDDEASAEADESGRWRIELPARQANGVSFDVEVRGSNLITIRDVLVGEVWICSGQSNMEWPVKDSANARLEMEAADHPQIRLFDVPQHVNSPTPQEDVAGVWAVCSPQTVANFSAVGYYFGRELTRQADVPVGLIGTNWGGTRIEPWTPAAAFDQVEQLADYAEHLSKVDATTAAGQKYYGEYLERLEAWIDSARQQLEAGEAPGNPPIRNDYAPISNATLIYNAMVHGLTPISARGVIWYQGESNAADGLKYEAMKEALVTGWRNAFENPQLSFYWVQLAGFREPSNDPAGGGWGPIREAQRRALRLPHTGMAVALDIGNANDIHPRNKQDVGKRLARWALHDHFDEALVPSGPLYKSVEFADGKAVVSFDYVDGGLMVGSKQGLEPTEEVADGTLQRFAIAGADAVWHWADARIDGDEVIVWSDDVPEPAAVRYAYESNPQGANLYNREGLPAAPFKTDDWD